MTPMVLHCVRNNILLLSINKLLVKFGKVFIVRAHLASCKPKVQALKQDRLGKYFWLILSEHFSSQVKLFQLGIVCCISLFR